MRPLSPQRNLEQERQKLLTEMKKNVSSELIKTLDRVVKLTAKPRPKFSIKYGNSTHAFTE